MSTELKIEGEIKLAPKRPGGLFLSQQDKARKREREAKGEKEEEKVSAVLFRTALDLPVFSIVPNT